jgi:hypothetical protein
LSAKKQLKNVVPVQLPYTAIEWTRDMPVGRTESGTGMAHVFEDIDVDSLAQFGSVATDFAIDVIGSSIFEVEPQNVRRKTKGFVVDQKKAQEQLRTMKSCWESFNNVSS